MLKTNGPSIEPWETPEFFSTDWKSYLFYNIKNLATEKMILIKISNNNQ